MTPRLDWIDGQPYSTLYGDVFFSGSSGIAEKRHVFLGGNRLAERFAALRPDARFVIGETGFGTGLNFLVAWHLWEACASAGARMHVVSVEKHPLSSDELEATLAMWPELAPQARALLKQWSELANGWHRFRFASGRVHLTIGVGDAHALLTEIDVPADAWFLDGFAPAKNPDMWSSALIDEVRRLSQKGTTFATYSAAGVVRRGLEAAGFSTERVPGYGRKREMLRGTMHESPSRERSKPWFARPPVHPGPREAIIIGGGLAGCAAADSLATRGWRVTIIDRRGTVAAEASSNPQGILYARLAATDTALRRLVLTGYQHALRRIRQLLPESDDMWRRVGVLQLAFDADESARQKSLAAAGFPATILRAVSRDEAAALAKMDMPSAGLFFAGGGWIHPPALCRALVNQGNVEVRQGEVTALECGESLWRVSGPAGEIARSPVVVIAAAHESRVLAQTSSLPLRTISGQVTAVPATERSAKLSTVVSGEGYAAPARDGSHTIGATHRLREASVDVRAGDHATNLEMLARLAPALYAAANAANLDPLHLAGRAGVRCSSPDTMPLVGPVVEADAFARAYAPLARDATLDLREPAPWLPGLYVTAAHGSRGLVTTLLSGEILAALIDDEPSPMAASLIESVHPSRFALRGLIRGRIRGEAP